MPLRNFISIQIGFIFIVAGYGCMPVTSFQTARTVDPGSVYITHGGSLSGSGNVPENASSLILESGIRIGLKEQFDCGFRYFFPGTFLGDVKYQYYDSPTAAASIGLGTALTYDFNVLTAGDIILPMYFSWHPNDYLSLYGVPKYLVRLENGQDYSFFLCSMGIKIGKDSGVMLEYTLMERNGGGNVYFDEGSYRSYNNNIGIALFLNF